MMLAKIYPIAMLTSKRYANAQNAKMQRFCIEISNAMLPHLQ
jgi:hypothetical protein